MVSNYFLEERRNKKQQKYTTNQTNQPNKPTQNKPTNQPTTKPNHRTAVCFISSPDNPVKKCADSGCLHQKQYSTKAIIDTEKKIPSVPNIMSSNYSWDHKKP